jgi:hypothetical protein
MKNQLDPRYGASLIFGSFLMIITMVMHPSGGNFEHLLKISALNMGTHTLAIISIPFTLYGFWGLTKRLNGDEFFSKIALTTILLGMFAVMCAAAINGLAMPLYLDQYRNATNDIVESIRPVAYYSSALNHAFDLIFIGAVCMAVTMWSVAVFRTRALPLWIAYFGITLSLTAITALYLGFVFFDLTGFRIFIAGLVIWTICIGKLLGKNVSATTPINIE